MQKGDNCQLSRGPINLIYKVQGCVSDAIALKDIIKAKLQK